MKNTHTPANPRRAAVYCRVSSKRQAADNKHSLPAQEQACRTYLATLPDVAIDERYLRHDAESASDPDARHQFDQLLAAADRHEFDVLVVDIMDRLTRSGMADFFIIYGRLQSAGVELMIATEPFENTPEGEVMAGLRAYFAKKENKDRVRRIMRTKRGRVLSGKPLPGGHDLYGYRWTDPTKTQRRFDDEDSQAYRTVRRIWHYFLTDPHPTLRGPTTQLNADGVQTPAAYFGVTGAGTCWTVETIRLMLHNEEYWGGNNGMVKVWSFSSTEPEVEIPAFAPAYVTPEEAARVHARLAANLLRHGGKRPKRDWTAEGVLLHGGIARCAECGWALTPHTYKRVRADGTLLTLYRCGKRTMYSMSQCVGVRISTEVLDQAVMLAVDEHLSNSAYLRKALDLRDQAGATISGRVRELEQQLAATEQKSKNAAQFVLERGHHDPLAADVLAQATLLKAEMPLLQMRLAKAHETVARVRADTALQEDIISWTEAWADGFCMLSTAKQREFLLACGAEVRLWREGIRTPRARLVIKIPSVTETFPPPMDVEANQAVYGAEVAHIDADGIYVDTDQAAALLRHPFTLVEDDEVLAEAHRPVSTTALRQSRWPTPNQ